MGVNAIGLSIQKATRLTSCWVPRGMHSKAERFLRKALNSSDNQEPRVINVDKNAAYPSAIDELKKDKFLTKTTELWRVLYLNNIVEQNHRFIKRLVKPGMEFGSFNTARRTFWGYEAMNMIRKRQIQGVEKEDIQAQVEYARSNFWSGCITSA